jgi:hypothetical protein
MKKFIFLGLVSIGLLSISCKSTVASTISTPLSVTENIRPLDADITVDVNKKISGESSALYFLCFRLKGDSKYVVGVDYSTRTGLFYSAVSKAKSAAAYKAVIDSKTDLIVHPNYVVDVENYVFFKKVNVKVTGYAGKINKIYQQNNCNPCSTDWKGAVIK